MEFEAGSKAEISPLIHTVSEKDFDIKNTISCSFIIRSVVSSVSNETKGLLK